LLFVNRDLGQRRRRMMIRGMWKEQVMAKVMSPKQEAGGNLHRCFIRVGTREFDGWRRWFNFSDRESKLNH